MPRINDRQLSPFWQTTDHHTVQLYYGHVVNVLERLPSRSVQCVVTSPPYWGLRSYLPEGHADGKYEIGTEPLHDCGSYGKAQCGRCYVCAMVAVFRPLQRVLRRDGTVWLNLGDTYGGNSGGERNGMSGSTLVSAKSTAIRSANTMSAIKVDTNLPSGNLVGIPWRVAFALQADGWILRQDIIWAKPSPMPESVTNRCTKAHEYLFLLTLSGGYYYDQEVIKELGADGVKTQEHRYADKYDGGDACQRTKGGLRRVELTGKSNKRSVWTVAGANYPGAHFATYPPKLITPCILAGTSEHGACAECGAPYQRLTEKVRLKRERPNEYVKRTGEEGTGNSCANTVAGVELRTIGWNPSCSCGTNEVRPCVVLDPFIGSGTTAEVCIEHGRNCWGIDLSEEYLRKHAVERIRGCLLERPSTRGLIPGS